MVLPAGSFSRVGTTELPMVWPLKTIVSVGVPVPWEKMVRLPVPGATSKVTTSPTACVPSFWVLVDACCTARTQEAGCCAGPAGDVAATMVGFPGGVQEDVFEQAPLEHT